MNIIQLQDVEKAIKIHQESDAIILQDGYIGSSDWCKLAKKYEKVIDRFVNSEQFELLDGKLKK